MFHELPSPSLPFKIASLVHPIPPYSTVRHIGMFVTRGLVFTPCQVQQSYFYSEVSVRPEEFFESYESGN